MSQVYLFQNFVDNSDLPFTDIQINIEKTADNFKITGLAAVFISLYISKKLSEIKSLKIIFQHAITKLLSIISETFYKISIFIIFPKDFAATATIRNISAQMLDTAYDAGIWEFEFLCQSIGSVFLINQIFGIIRRSCLWVGRWR